MHVVDDVHCIVVNASNLREHHLVVLHYLFKVQLVRSQYGDTFNHDRTRLFAATTVDGEQECLSQVAASTEELNLAADILVRYAASNSVVVRTTYFAHEGIVFVLD